LAADSTLLINQFTMAVLSTMMVALAAGSALGSVIPSHVGTTQTFSVQQVPNLKHVRHGPSALLKAYRKYGATVPDSLLQAASRKGSSVAAAAAPRSTGSAVTTPEEYDVRINHPDLLHISV
jgi:aspergillopepsin I